MTEGPPINMDDGGLDNMTEGPPINMTEGELVGAR
jgi:hypothetical protein